MKGDTDLPTLTLDMPIVAFDFETTGRNPTTAGIVQYGIAAQASPDKPVKRTSKIVACTQDVTPGAEAIHGISNDEKNGGIPLAKAVETLYKSFAWAHTHGGLIVAYNMPFDWTLFVHACNEVSYRPHPHIFVQRSALYDPLTVDRRLEKGRKGPKNLETLIDLFGLRGELDSSDTSHNAERDAEAALRIAREQLGIYPRLAKMTYPDVTPTMQRWHVEWADDYEQYLRRTRDADAEIGREWPLITARPAGEEDFEDDSPPFEPNEREVPA